MNPTETVCVGKFGLSGSRRLFDVILTNSVVKYTQTGSSNSPLWKEIRLDDIIGAHCMKGKLASDPKAYLSLFVYGRGRTMTGAVDLHRRRHVVVFSIQNGATYPENMAVAEMWKRFLERLTRPLPLQGFRHPYAGIWLVVINPAGGQGKAEKLFRERVVPIFAEAGIPFETVISERAGHVTDCAKRLDLGKYSALIMVSGDGLIHEAVNGLMMRSDWYDAVQMPLGFVPGGSGNALAATIHEECGEPFQKEFIKHSALLLAKSIPVPLDLLYTESLVEKRYAFLSVGWGLLADIDIESEKFRSLGETRFTVGALQRLVDLRKYSGTVSYLPANASTPPLPFHPLYESDSSLPRPRTGLLASLSDPVPPTWIQVSGDFISVYLVVISRLGISSVGVPQAKLNDGLAYLYWIKAGTPKTAVTSFLLNMSSGDHLKSEYVEVVPVKAFRLEPKGTEGILTIDGERVPYGPIQGQILPSLATVLSRKISEK